MKKYILILMIALVSLRVYAGETTFSRTLNTLVSEKRVTPDQMCKLLMSHPYKEGDQTKKVVPFAPHKRATDAEFNAVVGAIDYAHHEIVQFFEGSNGVDGIIQAARRARYVHGGKILSPQDAVSVSVQSELYTAHHKQLLIYYLLATRGETEYNKNKSIFEDDVSALNARNTAHPIFQNETHKSLRERLFGRISDVHNQRVSCVFYGVGMDTLTQHIKAQRKAVGLFQSQAKCNECAKPYMVVDVAKTGVDCGALMCICEKRNSDGFIAALQEWEKVQENILPAPGKYVNSIS